MAAMSPRTPLPLAMAFLGSLAWLSAGASGCGGPAAKGGASAARETLTLSAFSVMREPYSEALLPAFERWYELRTGHGVDVEASYGASGAQSRSVVEGWTRSKRW